MIQCVRKALGAEVIELADKLGAPIVKALLGKAVVPDDHPLTTCGLGLLGTTPSQEAMEQADALLIIGSSFPYMEYLPKPGQAKGVQIDDKPDRIGLRFPVEVGLVGDARPTVAALLRFVGRKEERSFLEQAQAGMREWWELMRTRALNSLPFAVTVTSRGSSPPFSASAKPVTEISSSPVRSVGDTRSSCGGA